MIRFMLKTSREEKEKVSRVQRGHHPSYVMVLWGASHQGISLHFCEKSVKTGAPVYQEDVLQGVMKPLNATLFSGQKWVFQQNSAPAHKAKTTQEWLRRNVLAFVRAEDWPSGSPDLNPLDYKLFLAVLEDTACLKHHNNLDSLKRSLVKAAAEIPLEMVHACRDSRVARASQGLHRAAILSDIIIDKN
jgi:inhibitor of nuclear factor kappa-B kinase subunit alpha